MPGSSRQNYYELLQVPQSASPAEIKAAYHRLLLSRHPDKTIPSTSTSTQTGVDIGLLKEAFITLSSPESRMRYDSELLALPGLSSRLSRSRPAHVVSLEDFEDLGEVWAYGCRCGGRYGIGEEEMERDVHLIACSSCSEVIWVGYEACPPDNNGTPDSS